MSLAAIAQEGVRPEPGAEASPCVFFLPRHATSWVRMWDLIEVLRAERRVEPVLVLATAEMAGKAGFCRARGVAAIEVAGEIERRLTAQAPRLQARLSALEAWSRGRERLGNLLPVSLLRLWHLRRRLRVEREIFHTLCTARRPAAIFVAGDRELSPVPPMLRVARDLGIPGVIAFSGVPDTAGAAGLRKAYPRFRVEWRYRPPLLNFYAARRYPDQVCDSRFGRLLFSPGWLVLALAGLDMLSADPWVQGGGNSRYILQNSRRRMQQFVDKGIAEDKHVFIGDPTLDPLHRACRERSQIRSRLERSLGLAAGRKLVVMSVPNDAEHGICSWEEHLARMASYMEPLARSGAEVVLSLHPKSRPADYGALAERLGLRFADRPLVEILPAADLYVCSSSSTVLWANLAAVPAINLDYFGHGNFEFWDNPAVANVTSPADFAAALETALGEGSAEAHEAIEDYAAAMAEDCLFDGRASRRFCAFVAELSGSGESAEARAGLN